MATSDLLTPMSTGLSDTKIAPTTFQVRVCVCVYLELVKVTQFICYLNPFHGLGRFKAPSV